VWIDRYKEREGSLKVFSRKDRNPYPRRIPPSPLLSSPLLSSPLLSSPLLSSLMSRPQYELIGEQFLRFYYAALDGDRNQLSSLYKDNSMLTVERNNVQGTALIMEKLLSYPRMQHKVTSAQFQPLVINSSILILVNGELKQEGQEHELKFSQVFSLAAADAQGTNFYITNDMFSLNYG